MRARTLETAHTPTAAEVAFNQRAERDQATPQTEGARGLCHLKFQVDTIDALFRNWHVIKEHNVEIEQRPGSPPHPGAVFLYFKGPERLTYKNSWNVRLIEDDYAPIPRTFDSTTFGAIDMRGAAPKSSTKRQILTSDSDPDADALRIGAPHLSSRA